MSKIVIKSQETLTDADLAVLQQIKKANVVGSGSTILSSSAVTITNLPEGFSQSTGARVIANRMVEEQLASGETLDSITWEAPKTIEYVDLGLASGTKWLKFNLGATAVTDYGLYYQWGATIGYPADSAEGKAHSTWSTCPFNGGAASYDASYWAAHKSEVVDNNNILLPANDCVYQATNGLAKLPTWEQIDELCALSSKSWKTNYNGSGIHGWEFTGNGNTLFVPAAGYFSGGSFRGAGNVFACWSASLRSDDEDGAWYLDGGSDGVYSDSDNRCSGYSARGVLS